MIDPGRKYLTILFLISVLFVGLLDLPIGIVAGFTEPSGSGPAWSLNWAQLNESFGYSGALESPVSAVYTPPPGIMPIVVLQGNPYEMGYQYGLQARNYIALVRDAAWASALSVNSSEEVLEKCDIYRGYISSELTKFEFSTFFQGISDSMNDQGVKFSPTDCIVMNYWGGKKGPEPGEHCTAMAAFGDSTEGRGVIAGVNFDYYLVPSNTYEVILALFPKEGHPCIIPTGIGRMGSNAAFNDEGLIYILAAAAQQGPGDYGPGITGFLEIPYVSITCSSVPHAEAFLTNSTRMMGLNHFLVDACGNAEVLEATRARFAIRKPGENNETDYIIASNFYKNQSMKPSQKIWDPLEYYPSAYYRYITAEKMLDDNFGKVNYSTFVQILSLTDWWNGQRWILGDQWSSNTINRFRPDVASLYSIIMVQDDHLISICTGNPGWTSWGNLAPEQTGTYVNLTVGKSPENLVFNLRSNANASMWKAVQTLGKAPPKKTKDLWDQIRDRYWRGVWWLDHAVLETNATLRAVAWGRSATNFSEVIAMSEDLQSYNRSIPRTLTPPVRDKQIPLGLGTYFALGGEEEYVLKIITCSKPLDQSCRSTHEA